MTNTVLSSFLTPRDEREDGFTLIEILVVIIIIGILAAVAIPIFLNQQRTARDSATTSDVRNLATNVETALVANPEAKTFTIANGGEDSTTATVTVGTGAKASSIDISKTQGTVLTISAATRDGAKVANEAPTAAGGVYVIEGSNADGQEYKGGTGAGAKFRVYNSAKGGIQ